MCHTQYYTNHPSWLYYVQRVHCTRKSAASFARIAINSGDIFGEMKISQLQIIYEIKTVKIIQFLAHVLRAMISICVAV